MKPGRNDPCPCGSGRKYKHCCLRTDSAPRPGDLEWDRVMRATEGLASALLRTAKRHFGIAALEEAWDEFNLWEADEPFDPESPYTQVFMPWFFYDWLPDSEETEVPASAHTVTAAQAHLRSAGQRLEPMARRYVEAAGAARFSFYEVLEADLGRGMRLRDLVLDREVDVMERAGSEYPDPGDIIYTKVVPIEGIAVLEGCSSVLIPPSFKADIEAFRARVTGAEAYAGDDLAGDYDFELRSIYLGIADTVLDPPLPALANTDGDPLELRTLIYDIDSPRETFDALKDLAVDLPEEDLLQGAKHDADGVLVRAEITWRQRGNPVHAGFEYTSLGTIRIAPRRLEAEVNSARRDERLRALIDERLGDKARFRVAKVQSMRSILERERTPDEEAAAERTQAESERLAELPEVKAKIAEMMRKHQQAWIDQKVPALGDRTPREAARDPAGRVQVERLIKGIERTGAAMKPPLDPGVVAELRTLLGLRGGA